MAGRLRRFLHLERPRAPDPGGAVRGFEKDRFAGLEGVPSRPMAEAAGASAGRFDPDPGSTLELAAGEEGAQPFRRCMCCGRDHGLYDTVCATCGAALDTPEQVAFNEGLWAERRAEDARLALEAAEGAARAAREAEELAKLRREMGIELARQVGERERTRLGGTWGGVARDPIGLLLLRALPERWRLRAGLALGAAWLLLVVTGLARRSPAMVVVAIIALVGMVVPRGGGPGRLGGFGSWP
jgi:hypothetical protein